MKHGRWTTIARRNITIPQIAVFMRNRWLVHSAAHTIRLQLGEETTVAMPRSFGEPLSCLTRERLSRSRGWADITWRAMRGMPPAVSALRERKYRKEKPFAVMVKDPAAARDVIELSGEAESLLTSVARPIVLAAAKMDLPGVAPDNDELGLMLPYTPLQHMLFAAGAPDILVMTSANRSSEPIAYDEQRRLRAAGRCCRRVSGGRASYCAAGG